MSTQRCLLLQVHFSHGRYHGAGAWPPSPSRVFQALVAGAGPQQALPESAREALHWLEGLPPPVIHAPTARLGQKVQYFVPHNDLDTKDADPRAIESIRVGKIVQPHLFNERVPISYLWAFSSDPSAEKNAREICKLALGIYQLGRGLDAASATAKELSSSEGIEHFRTSEGQLLRPSVVDAPNAMHDGCNMLDCPVLGSLDSLTARYSASAQRFGVDKSQRKPTLTFSQPPRPTFVAVPYGSAHVRILYELRSPDSAEGYAPWRLALAAEVVQRIRDAAMERLIRTLPEDQKPAIENALLGRPIEGRAIPAEQRIRIVPLPSIGHEHVDHGIRRVLVDIPASCPLAIEDVRWAFSGLPLADAHTGEILAMVVAAENVDMLRHYGIGDKLKRWWRTITPIALGSRYGLDGPMPEKLAAAVADALRHEGVGARVVEVRAQKTPFERHGVEAARFATGTRFSEAALWHLDVTLDRALHGPLVLGDGRYLGLGVLAPVRDIDGLLRYRITEGLAEVAQPQVIAGALRRAVMARCGERRGGKVDPYVHGHDGSGPMRKEPHLHFQFDPVGGCLWIMAPHIVDHREPRNRAPHQWNDVVQAMEGFSRLLAGSAGALDLRSETIDWTGDPLLGLSRIWETVTPYAANRHRDAGSAHAALIEDVRQALVDAGLPTADIEILQCRANADGLAGHVRLTFAVAIEGPMVLGRSRFLGGGLFRAIGHENTSD